MSAKKKCNLTGCERDILDFLLLAGEWFTAGALAKELEWGEEEIATELEELYYRAPYPLTRACVPTKHEWEYHAHRHRAAKMLGIEEKDLPNPPSGRKDGE